MDPFACFTLYRFELQYTSYFLDMQVQHIPSSKDIKWDYPLRISVKQSESVNLPQCTNSSGNKNSGEAARKNSRIRELAERYECVQRHTFI
jgi:hypothetical protein